MKKILQVSTVPQTLGIFVAPVMQPFRERGWRVDAMSSGATTYPRCGKYFDRCFDIELSRNPLDPANLLTAAARLRAHVEREGYDIVHAHTPVAAFIMRYALRELRGRGGPAVIYTAHGFHFHQGANPVTNSIFLGLEKLAGAWTDYLIVINDEDVEAARTWKIVPPERLVYMPGIGVDTREYNPRRVTRRQIEALRNELGVGPEVQLFTMVAEYRAGKRHRDALEALARLGRPDVHILFVGTGEIFDETVALAERLGVTRRAHFLGYRDDVSLLVRAACALILPSQREGLPRSILESLALGVPAIGTNIRGVRELLGDGCGLLHEVGDVGGLVRAMRWMVEHPEQRASMGRRARKRMIEHYDTRHIVELHARLYDDALRGREPAPSVAAPASVESRP